jgi:nitrilase
MINVAVLQLPSQGLSSSKIDYYLRIAQKRGVSVVLFGEYILNPFFKELQNAPISMIKEQSSQQIESIKVMAKEYNMVIVAPVILVKKKKLYKVTMKATAKSTTYYEQQILIDYEHFDEASFFANETQEIKSPLIFSVNRVKFAIMNGFELHFDKFFEYIDEKNVDCVLTPTTSTFESNQRWQELLKMRSFTHNCYILRANRIGEYKEDGYVWKFYGDSILTNPYGELENHLGNSEELMIVQIDHKDVLSAKKEWRFTKRI